jgi:LemA protein
VTINTVQIVDWSLACAVLFWGLGAYNRLMNLRNQMAQQFVGVRIHHTERVILLMQLSTTLGQPNSADSQTHSVEPNLAQALGALRTACLQIEAACTQAQIAPVRVSVMHRLCEAEGALNLALAGLSAVAVSASSSHALGTLLQSSDAALAFAKRQFNEAVLHYNLAIRQFPTCLLVGLFGFNAAFSL